MEPEMGKPISEIKWPGPPQTRFTIDEIITAFVVNSSKFKGDHILDGMIRDLKAVYINYSGPSQPKDYPERK